MNLSDIFAKRPDILADKSKLQSAISDFYAGKTAEINRMLKAYEVGIIEAVVNDSNKAFIKQRIVNLLVTQHDMIEEKANWAVDEWINVLNPTVLSAYKLYITQKKQEEISIKEALKEENIIRKAEEDKKKQDQYIINSKVGNLVVDYNDYSRYMNLDLSKGEIVYGIPCGVGDSDYGFIVKGTGTEDINKNQIYPSLLAIVYNFLIRDTHIQKENYPQYIKNHFYNHELDYGHVYRFMMILLDLIVYPAGENVLKLNVIGDIDEFNAAVNILNEYLAVFSRLIKSEICRINVIIDSSGDSISAHSKADYYVENLQKDSGLRRRIRYGARINYRLGKSDRKDLEFILKEISPFSSFKRGQFDALCSMLNANGHAVCIMPTGSGKSLIYYLACLLQPQVVFVVSPTDILIKDQIRNLRKFHHFDNVTHLKLTSENDFSFFKPGNNLIFLTPSTFQNRNLFGIFQRWKKQISYVVLDEIHCISNWGHDFRPEYLMLSRNINQYLGEARYLGFTATANYTVAQDIQKQLDFPIENFFSPVLYEKYNIKYDFREVNTTEEMFFQVKVIANDIIHRNERAIIFAKNEETAIKIAETIGYEADVFTRDNDDSYSQFASGLCKILVASEDLGIGVNLPNVNCTVHFGVPISKNEYVQEIGRAGRAEEKVTSYVIYLSMSEENIPNTLLKRETIIDNLPQMLMNMSNDYSDAYHKLNCGADTSNLLFEQLIDIYSDFHAGNKVAYIIEHPSDTIEIYIKFLYMLFVTGYLKDWYTYRSFDGSNKIQMIIDVCSVPNGGHAIRPLDDEQILERMINTSRNYFASMGNDRESIFNVSRAKSIEDVFRIYVKWYYEKFLYHHKEQFLDFLEFLNGNKNCDTLKITEEIEDYFILPFVQIKEDEEYYNNMSFEDLSQKLISGIGKNTLTNLERINSNNYSYKLDYILFLGTWSRIGRFEANRLERLWDRLMDDEKRHLYSTLCSLYGGCSTEAKWYCLKYFEDRNNAMGINIELFVDNVYKINPRDYIYYGILATSANNIFRKFIRR